MAHVDQRDSLISQFQRRRISAIIRTHDAELAGEAMRAAVAGGFRVCEFTLTTPNALGLIAEFAKQDDLLVGAGTVMSATLARQACDAGARFLVSPVCDAEVIAEAHRLGALSIPGTFTPGEMHQAHRAGADFVKLFPEAPQLPEYIRAILGPMPYLRIFPTAGVRADNLAEVLAAGAAGAGFVRSLFDPQDLETHDFKAIERRAATIVSQLPPPATAT